MDSTPTLSEPIERFARGLKRVSLAFFAAAAALALYAALERRGLHADGASFLMRLVERETFDLSERARAAVQAVLQAPTLAALRLGLADLAGAGFVFSLTLELVPLALLALCYAALPAGRKHFFYFPLLHYLAASLSASASPIVEGLAAAAYFWLVFYVLLFRPLGAAGLAGMALLAAPLLWVHEAMGGLAPMLAVAAAGRARRDTVFWRSAVFAAFGFWFAAVAIVQLRNIVVPQGAGSRGDLLDGFIGFWWLLDRQGGGINVPAWLGLLALLAVNVIAAAGRRTALWIAGGFGAFAVAGVAIAALAPGTVSPAQHFGARVNPAIFSLILAVGALGSLARPERQRWWARPPILAVCAMLGVSGLLWHAIEVKHWSTYLGTIRQVLAGAPGLATPQAVEAGLGARERRIFRAMSWPWAFPELSVVLAPDGKIAAIVARERAVRWKTWDPADPDQVPKSRFWDASAYRAAMRGRTR